MAVSPYFLYAMAFIVGVIIGRITMAIQYALMKDVSRKKL